MKWFMLSFGVLMLVAGCQKKQEPVRTMFSGNVGLALTVNQSIKIQPDNPKTGDVLTVATPGNISAKSITWYVNNRQHAMTNSLQSGFQKGDSITAVVSYTENKGEQKELVTPAVLIHDAPPIITSINIQPMYPTIASTMQVTVQASDADGDPVAFDYKWYVNNAPVEDQTGDSFSCGSYKHGDVVHVDITPSDGEQNGLSATSSYISIQDTPPVITSKPPVSITGSTFLYKVEAVDIDNDHLTYKLESAPQGMTINHDGVISWDPKDAELPLETTVKVVVDDGYGGKAYQTFNLNLGTKTP